MTPQRLAALDAYRAQLPAQLRAVAEHLGRNMAEGTCTWDDLTHTLHELAHKHTERTGRDASGLGTRLVWHAREAADAHAAATWAAEDAIRRSVRKLMEANATKAEIEEAAGANRGILEWPAIFDILRDEAARWRHLSRWRR